MSENTLPQVRWVGIELVKPNEDNPRSIKDKQFQKLVSNVQANKWMLELRPIVVDETGKILGGNMRYRAAEFLGWDKVPVVCAKELTAEQKRAFIILDNQDFGEWDFEILSQQFDADELIQFGFEASQLGVDSATEHVEFDASTQQQYFLNIKCVDEQHAQNLYEKLIAEGLDVKIVT